LPKEKIIPSKKNRTDINQNDKYRDLIEYKAIIHETNIDI